MSAVKKTTTEARLYELVRGLVELSDSDYSVMDKLITGIQIDSRFVRKSDLFIACFGRNHDARNYIDLAIESGCAAVLAEFTVGMRRLDMRSNVPVIGIDNLPSKVSEIQAVWGQRAVIISLRGDGWALAPDGRNPHVRGGGHVVAPTR